MDARRFRFVSCGVKGFSVDQPQNAIQRKTGRASIGNFQLAFLLRSGLGSRGKHHDEREKIRTIARIHLRFWRAALLGQRSKHDDERLANHARARRERASMPVSANALSNRHPGLVASTGRVIPISTFGLIFRALRCPPLTPITHIRHIGSVMN